MSTVAGTTITPGAHRRRWRRRLLIGAAVLVALVIVGRLVLDPIAAHYTRRALEGMEGYKGSFDRVHVSVIPPAYEITRIKLVESPEGKWKEPLVYADHVRTSIAWRRLLDGLVVMRVRANGPKIVLVRAHEKKTKKELPSLGQQLEQMSPLRIDRVEIHEGEVLYAERPAKDAPRLWIHDIEASAANLVTRKALAEGKPATARLRAVVQRSGKVAASVTADPFAERPTFEGKAELVGLDLRELWGFTAEKSDLQAAKGALDVYAEFEAKNGKLKGGVKPMLKNVEIRATKDDFVDKVKAWFADKAYELVADEKPSGARTAATVIPLRGDLSKPDAQLWPAVLGVIRNGFVVGLKAGFDNLPPAEAPRKEGVVEQAVEALKKNEGPPEAQPTKAEEQAAKTKNRQARSPQRR